MFCVTSKSKEKKRKEKKEKKEEKKRKEKKTEPLLHHKLFFSMFLWGLQLVIAAIVILLLTVLQLSHKKDSSFLTVTSSLLSVGQHKSLLKGYYHRNFCTNC